MIDTAQSVNNYMLANAPTLAGASPIAYELLKVLARQLVFGCKTSKEHATSALIQKYSRLYTQGVIATIVQEAIADEASEKSEKAAEKRARRLSKPVLQQPLLCV